MVTRIKGVSRHAVALAERDGGLNCYYCGRELALLGDIEKWQQGYEFAYADHVIPKSRGGSNSLDNLVLACRLCNTEKGAKTADEYLEWLEKQ